MKTIPTRIFAGILKKIIASISICIALSIANSAFATLIDFDDLNPQYNEDSPCWCDNPLTDQYASLGVMFSGAAWVNGYNAENSLTTGTGGAWIQFLGPLPTAVSMNITSQVGDVIFIDAYGPTGLVSQKRSQGYSGEVGSTTPIPNELISVSSELGISTIEITSFFNTRTGASVDNINFSFTSVPEPSPIMLLAIGLFGFTWRIYSKNKP